MGKRFGILAGIVLVLLMALVAYHRFPVQTKRTFFSIFPVFTRVSVDQPIGFNHIRHEEAAHLNCTFCHRYVERHRSAGIPNIDLCRACHSTDAISKRPEALKVVKYVQEGREIPWRRMYELPKFVVFPHWIHVQNSIDCSICHGLTGEKERPVKMVDRNYMAWCMDCHKRRGADIDCYTCHSS
jgi:Zn finger protein HypA/HybF involved in hydrogenase expression